WIGASLRKSGSGCPTSSGQQRAKRYRRSSVNSRRKRRLKLRPTSLKSPSSTPRGGLLSFCRGPLWKVGNLNPAPVSVRIAHHHDLDGGILARRSWRRARVIRGPLPFWSPLVGAIHMARNASGETVGHRREWVQRVKRIFLSPCHRKHNL